VIPVDLLEPHDVRSKLELRRRIEHSTR
jgi:hypothetical protein